MSEIKPWTIIGYRVDGRPIYLIAGGAPEDDDNNDPGAGGGDDNDDDAGDGDDDDSGGDNDDAGDDKAKGKKKPEPDDKVDRAELKKVVNQRQDLKRRLREAEKKAADLEKANETDAEKARREAAEKAAEEATDRWKPALVHTHAKAQLMESGVKPEKIKRLIKLMDMDDIDVDSDMNVVGVEEQVDALQEEYPELFSKKPDSDEDDDEQPKRKKRAPNVDGGNKQPAPPKQSMEEMLMKGLRGGR